MNSCIFCQIISGKEPCYKVYEDKHFFAFLDKYPYAYGHTLLIPKKHYRWIYDIKEPGLDLAATKISQAMIKSLDVSSVTYLTLGFMVNHAHLHLIPRQPGDQLISEDSLNRIHITLEQMKSACRLICQHIK